ncbi:WG repeat-containing protein [Sediminibacterium ginsengisoli]|uniref:WG containing repeat-containing protein n=1 Tax=Sediminibacterium ginsengisoli TaxID=413434 RepID=A0A1T4N7S9_9BACT|nr:WG repeat-containing protein [Sediminibacterium ginsengisoli]SJZ75262.1 WG containing repeat-containing protein [Sediminibacterium ginsengisoli]
MKKAFLSACFCLTCFVLSAQQYELFTAADGKQGLRDENGKTIIQARYNSVDSFFSGGYARVWRGTKVGLVDQTGKEVLAPDIYNHISYFVNGTSFVNIGGRKNEDGSFSGGKYGAINKAGRQIITPAYDYIDYFNDAFDIALVNNGCTTEPLSGDMYGGKCGLIDLKTGRLILPLQYSFIDAEMAEGLYLVNIGGEYAEEEGVTGGKWGYINARGKIIIPPQFDSADYFENGRAGVSKNGRSFYIDKTGKEIK